MDMDMNDVKHPGSTATGGEVDDVRKPADATTTATDEKAFDISVWVEKVRQLPDIRHDLVKRVKAEIAAGTYETPERIDAAIDRLMDEEF